MPSASGLWNFEFPLGNWFLEETGVVARQTNSIGEVGVEIQSRSPQLVRRGAGLITSFELAHNNLIPARGPAIGMCSGHIGPLPGYPRWPGLITPTCHRQVVDQAKTIACLWVVEDWERFVLEAPTVFDENGIGECQPELQQASGYSNFVSIRPRPPP